MDPDHDGKLFVGKGTKPEYLTLALANRHGLVAGATGTGKTVTLQVLAEGLSRAGVSVFAADVEGDLSGIAAAGQANEALVKRAKDMGFDDDRISFRWCSGICSENRAIRCAPPSRRSGPCFCLASWISTKCRRGCRTSLSELRMNVDCCSTI